MPIANIEKWTECPECEMSLEFNGYRENPLVCKSSICDWSEDDHSFKKFTDFMTCPDCGSFRVEVTGGGYRENGVYCKSCGLEEGDMY